MKRRRDCLPGTHPGTAVLHSKRRPRVIPVSVRSHIPLYARHSPVSLSHCTPFTAFLTLRLSRVNLTNQRRVSSPPSPSASPPSLMSRRLPYVPHDHALSPQCLHLTASFPSFLHLSHFGHPPIALLTLYRHSSCPSHPFHPPLPFFLTICQSTELSIHYSICYLICVCCLVCSLHYPLLLVGCRGSRWKQDSLWIFLDGLFRYLGSRPYG